MWRIDGNGGRESFIIGTMHVKDAKAFGRINEMYGMIDGCAVFAPEFNLEEAEFNLTENGMDLPEGMTLEQMLGEKKFKKIRKRILKTFGLDISFFNRSLPIMVTNLATQKILSDDMQSSLDETLFLYAKNNDKIIIGVETFREQMDILGQIPLDYQLKQLKEMAKGVKGFRKQILKTAELYEKGEILKLYKGVKKNMAGLRKLMLYDRNINMADRMEKMIMENPSCFAIGAGHLPGKKGVLKLLKDKGFTCSAMMK